MDRWVILRSTVGAVYPTPSSSEVASGLSSLIFSRQHLPKRLWPTLAQQPAHSGIMDDKASMHPRPAESPMHGTASGGLGTCAACVRLREMGTRNDTDRRGGGVIRVCGFIQRGMYTMVGCNALYLASRTRSHGRREWRSEESQRGFPMRVSSWSAAIHSADQTPMRGADSLDAVPPALREIASAQSPSTTPITVPTHRIPRSCPQYHPVPLLHLPHERVLHAQDVAVGLEVLSGYEFQRSTEHPVAVTTGPSSRMFRGAGDSEREMAMCHVPSVRLGSPCMLFCIEVRVSGTSLPPRSSASSNQEYDCSYVPNPTQPVLK